MEKTEIAIIDRASASFDAIDKAAQVATAALDRFLARVDAINAKAIDGRAFESAFDDIADKARGFELPDVSVGIIPNMDMSGFSTIDVKKQIKDINIGDNPKIRYDNVSRNPARQMTPLKVGLGADPLGADLDGLLGQIDKVEASLGDLSRAGAQDFEQIGDAIQKNEGQVAGLKGGILDFASKLGPALYAAEKGFELVSSAAGKAIEAINRGDEIAKTSRALHIDAQAFQELDYAIQRGGGSSEDFSMGLRTLNRQIAELKKGSSTAKDAFGRLGLSLEDVNSLGLEGTLYAVSDALHNMGNTEDVDDIMQTLLGRGGFKLAAAFSVGSEELENLREQARETGTILQDDALALSEEGADRLLDATLSLQSVWQSISNDIMPTVVDGLGKVTDFFKENQEFIGKIEKLVSRTIGAALDGVLSIADTLADIADTVLTPMIDLGNLVMDVGGQLVDDIAFLINGPNEKQHEDQMRMMNQMAQIGGMAYTQRLKILGEIQAQTFVLDEQLDATQRLNKNMENWNNRRETVQEKNAKDSEYFLRNYSDIKFQEWIGKQPGASNMTNEQYRQAYNDFVNNPENKAQVGTISNAQEWGEATELAFKLEDNIANRKRENEEAEALINKLKANEDNYIRAGKFDVAGDIAAMESALEAQISNNNYAINKLNEQLATTNKSIELFDARTREFMGRQSEYSKQIAHNTKKVKIDKDSILFMKQMATAEIINKYNEISNTVNTTFNSNEKYSKKEVEQLNGAMVEKTLGASSV